MSRKNKIIISISGIVIVLLLLLGLTYGFYLTRINGNSSDKSVTVSLANLELTYSDGNGLVESNNMIPGESITKTFTVENTGNKKVINYLIYLEDVINTFEDKNDLKVTLTCTSNSGTCNGNTLTYPSSNTVIGVNDIEVKEKQEFSLKVEFLETNDNQDDNQNKKFSGNVKLKDMKSTSSEIVSNEGENILEINNAKAINHLLVYGNSTQEVRSGKNLAKISRYRTAAGTIISDANGIYRVKGDEGYGAAAASAGQTFIYLNPISSTNKKITVSFYATRYTDGKWKDSSTTVFQLLFGPDESNYAKTNKIFSDYTQYPIGERKLITYTFTPTYDLQIMCIRLNNMEWEIELNTLQIEEGSTATDYEPYGATPSPDIPSEINSVGDLVTDTSDTNYGKYKIPVTVSSKNLWNNDINVSMDKNKRSALFTFNASDYDWIKSNITYTFSEKVIVYEDDTRTNPRLACTIEYSDGTSTYNSVPLTKGTTKNNVSITFKTSDKKVSAIKIRLCDYGSNSGNIWHAEAENMQLEVNSTATDYVPYKKETTNIYLDEPLRKIGNKSDYIDLKNGKVVRNIDSYTFSGDENFVSEGNTKLYSFRKIEGMPSSNSVNSLSNRYRITSQNYNSITDASLFQYGNSYINLGNAGKSTISEFKEWLKSNTVKVIWSTSKENTETVSLPSILTDESTKTIEIRTNIKPSKTQIEYVQ